MDKMREAFAEYAKREGFPTGLDGTYGGYMMDDSTAFAWRVWQAAQAESVPVVGEVDCYDAGLLNDFGGGDVEWWQDYIRAELARAHEHYVAQSAHSIPAAELEALRTALMLAIETDGGISYDDADDFVGERSCCGTVPSRPHLPDCWVLRARAAIAGEKP